MKPQPKENKPMTIEGLSDIVKAGFDDMATKEDVAGLDQRLGKVESNLTDISKTVHEIEMKVDRALYKEIDRHENLLHQLEHKTHVKLEW